jgi:rhodanese-related sulfurtransferase
MRTPHRVLSLAVLLLLATLLAATGCSTDEATSPSGTGEPAETAGYATVDVQTANDALSSMAAAQIVDVREPEEWAETGVPQGAVLIPLAEVESRAPSELDAGSPVYVICRSGNRSRTASDVLIGLGFTEVYNVDGGVTAWVDAGLPTETYQP